MVEWAKRISPFHLNGPTLDSCRNSAIQFERLLLRTIAHEQGSAVVRYDLQYLCLRERGTDFHLLFESTVTPTVLCANRVYLINGAAGRWEQRN